ncbi:MAG: hypothetical protein FJ291_10200 [Planctomycetes bacterium]|nr:hypothetical protein [Planctomycetota bacterium]
MNFLLWFLVTIRILRHLLPWVLGLVIAAVAIRLAGPLPPPLGLLAFVMFAAVVSRILNDAITSQFPTDRERRRHRHRDPDE